MQQHTCLTRPRMCLMEVSRIRVRNTKQNEYKQTAKRRMDNNTK